MANAFRYINRLFLNQGLSKHQQINSTLWGKCFFLRGDFTLFMSKSGKIWDHIFPLLFPKDSENTKSLDIGLWEVGAKRGLNGMHKFKKIVKKTFSVTAILHPLWAKIFKSKTTSFQHFSPRILKIQKSLDIGLQEVGAKIPINCVLFPSNSGYSKE